MKLLQHYSLILVLIIFSACSETNSVDMNNKTDNSTRQKFLAQIKQYNWNEPDKVFDMIEPAISFEAYSIKPSIGSSKLGGQPDLPKEFKWPTFHNQPMLFFGQINLSELNNLDKEGLLPKKGILYYFTYFDTPEIKNGTKDTSQEDNKKYKVLFFEGDISKITLRAFPENLISHFRLIEIPIRFHLVYRLPQAIESWKYENAKLNKKDAALFDSIRETTDNCDMILGTPNPIQYGVDYDWAFTYLNNADYNNPEVKIQVDKLRPEFINLFSFSMIGKFDKIGIPNCYFGILKKDLIEKKFDKVVFISQGT